MTPALLTELKRLDEAALPAPWFVDVCNVGESCWCRTIGNLKGNDDLEHCVVPSGAINSVHAQLIVALRNVAPALLEAVETMHAALETLSKCDGLCAPDECVCWTQPAQKALTRVAALLGEGREK